MKKITPLIFFAITLVLFFSSCKKENVLQLAPVGSLKINLTLKDYSYNTNSKTSTLQKLKKEVLPNSFKAAITIKGKNVPERTTTAEANYDGNFYQLSLPIEAPFNEIFTITITTRTDSTTWEGAQHDIIIQEDRLPYQASIALGISSIMDIDGNVYKTVLIGTQLWLTSNLKVTHYRNGDPITNASDAAQWVSLGGFNGAYCYLNNDQSNVSLYGMLYKHYTTMDSRGVCPSGWRVPTMTDWDVLATTLGGANVAGGMMKITGTDYWASPNVGADNSSGFSAYPSLGRGNAAAFDSQIGSKAIWWSTPMWDTNNGRVYSITNDNVSLITGPQPLEDGVAIRCIK